MAGTASVGLNRLEISYYQPFGTTTLCVMFHVLGMVLSLVAGRLLWISTLHHNPDELAPKMWRPSIHMFCLTWTG